MLFPLNKLTPVGRCPENVLHVDPFHTCKGTVIVLLLSEVRVAAVASLIVVLLVANWAELQAVSPVLTAEAWDILQVNVRRHL